MNLRIHLEMILRAVFFGLRIYLEMILRAVFFCLRIYLEMILGAVCSERQSQRCNKSAMTVAILFSLKAMQSLHNGGASHF